MDDYYDLIELPSGRHIPVPIAIELVGEEEVQKIPVSRRRRDENFFTCPLCKVTGFYSGICSDCAATDEMITEEELEEYLKKEDEDRRLKELAFVQLIKQKKYRKLRYIRADVEV